MYVYVYIYIYVMQNCDTKYSRHNIYYIIHI